jgi:hypothetical protein
MLKKIERQTAHYKDRLSLIITVQECKKMKKNILGQIFLFGLFLLFAVSAFAQSEDDFRVRQLSDNTVSIVKYNGTVLDVIIPETIYGLPVTGIEYEAFYGKPITSVVIPDTVTTIGSSAFSWHNEDRGRSRLARVVIGKNVKTIGSYAFSRNWNLVSIIIPDSVTEIGKGAFSGCGLTSLTLGKGLTAIPMGCFSGNKLTTLVVPEGVTEFTTDKNSSRDSWGAFQKNQLTEVILPVSLQSLGWNAFAENQLVSITLPASLQSIGRGAFQKNKISSLTIPEGVTVIGVDAFRDNPIVELVIPASLASFKSPSGDDKTGLTAGISSGAFVGTQLARITLPENMNYRNITAYGSSDNRREPRGFDGNFITFWDTQNQAGGTYVKRGQIWTKEQAE